MKTLFIAGSIALLCACDTGEEFQEQNQFAQPQAGATDSYQQSPYAQPQGQPGYGQQPQPGFGQPPTQPGYYRDPSGNGFGPSQPQGYGVPYPPGADQGFPSNGYPPPPGQNAPQCDPNGNCPFRSR